jgi:hypothetical protein
MIVRNPIDTIDCLIRFYVAIPQRPRLAIAYSKVGLLGIKASRSELDALMAKTLELTRRPQETPRYAYCNVRAVNLGNT